MRKEKKEYYSRLVKQSLKEGEKLIAEISYAFDRCPRHSQLVWSILGHLITVGLILHDLRQLQRNLEEGKLGDPTLDSILCVVNSLRKAQKKLGKILSESKTWDFVSLSIRGKPSMEKQWARIKDKTALIGIASPVIGSPPVYIPIERETDKDAAISAAIDFARTLPAPFLVYFLDKDKKPLAVYNPRLEQFAPRREAKRRRRRCAEGF